MGFPSHDAKNLFLKQKQSPNPRKRGMK
jgi:hypothetical protein